MKKIAIDLDGVMFDSEDLYRVVTEMYDADVHKKDTLIDNREERFQSRYNWSEEEFVKFYNDNFEYILRNCNLKSGVDLVLNKLKDKYELLVVTSRNDYETQIAREKLKSIGFENIKIYNNERHKIDKYLEEKVDYMIDDYAQICSNASDNNITAFYFKNNASDRLDKKGVINVNNWGEIYKYLILNDK